MTASAEVEAAHEVEHNGRERLCYIFNLQNGMIMCYKSASRDVTENIVSELLTSSHITLLYDSEASLDVSSK